MGSLEGYFAEQFEWTQGDAMLGENVSEIASFFKNRSVFVTGATGFIGKGVVEKLLRACSEVRSIYILLRPKRGLDIQSRLKTLLESTLFKTILSENPGVLSKVIPVAGDLSLPDLGLTPENQLTLQENVSVVINCAATVKFDEKLKFAFNINTLGTKRMVALCRKMKQLVVLVHVSTAYANSDLRTIKETVYPVTVDPENLEKCLETLTEPMVEKITPMLIHPKPNTYTFTKSLAEHILKEAEDLPICIIRPPIVVATWKEPEPGWVDNFNSATGPIVANGMGILRTLPCDASKMVDLMPLDLAVNMILAAAWYRGTTQVLSAGSKVKPIEVYNCCCGDGNLISWGTIVDWSTEFTIKYPFSKALWYPGTDKEVTEFWYAIKEFLWRYLPIHFLYLFEFTLGKPKGMKKLYRDVSKIKDLRPFTTQDWKFETRRSEELLGRMTEQDKQRFNFDIRQVPWENFMETYCQGIRKFLLKEDEKTLPKARQKMNRLKWIHKLFQTFLILIGVWLIARLF